jgi:D-erythro-7,8-dihydroneopterin triphosphate epimerase
MFLRLKDIAMPTLFILTTKGGSMKSAVIKITDLSLRTIIGGNDWERETKQDVIINVMLTYDAAKAIASDAMEDAVDYKRLKRRIIDEVEKSRFHLLEKLTANVLTLIMEDARVLTAKVRIDKPSALRFAKTVSIEMSDRRDA